MLNFKDFKKRKFVVNCKTKKEAKEFIDMSREAKIDGEDILSTWDIYGKETCYSFSSLNGSSNQYLSYCGREFFIDEGIEIVDFKEFKKDVVKNEYTFKELMTIIKEGEVWRNNMFEVTCKNGKINVRVLSNDKEVIGTVGFNLDTSLYTLSKNSYPFIKAFNLMREKGYTIESAESELKYKVDPKTNKVMYTATGKSDGWIENTMFSQNEIDGNWYISKNL